MSSLNQDDPNVKTSKNRLGSYSLTNWGKNHNELGQFDDEDMEMVQKEEEEDWVSTMEEEIPVNVAMLPIGVVLSVKGKTVIVDVKEEHHTVLSEGSFLWITETRVPLGYVIEKLGTLAKPCYSVRLESHIHVDEGTKVSLIVAEPLQQYTECCDAANDDKVESLADEKEEAGDKKKSNSVQTLLTSPNISDDSQAIAGTVLTPNRSETQMSPVMFNGLRPDDLCYLAPSFWLNQQQPPMYYYSQYQPYPYAVAPWPHVLNSNPFLPQAQPQFRFGGGRGKNHQPRN